MGHLQSFVVLLFLGSMLDATIAEIPEPNPKPKDNMVVKEGAPVDTTLMECIVAKPDGVAYTSLQWTRDGKVDIDPICTVTKESEACTPSTSYAITADDAKKHNLITKTPVTFTHAGVYACALNHSGEATANTTVYFGQLTVVGNPNCPEPILNIPTGATKNIVCDVSYKGIVTPGLTIKATDVDVPGTKGDADDAGIIKVTASYAIPTTAATAETTYTCAATANGAGLDTDCNIKVTVFPSKVATPPAPTTWAIVNTPVTIPCTMKADQTYTQVVWYKGSKADANKLCTGTAAAKGSCTADGYTLDDTKRHDLTVNNATNDHLFDYICNVQTVDSSTEEKRPSQLAVIKGDPYCSGTWDSSNLKLNCTVQFKGTTTAPTIKWTLNGKDEEIPDSTTGTVTEDPANWNSVIRHVTAKDASNKIYVCHVMFGSVELGSCVLGGASALSAKFYQSTLLSLAVVFLLNRFK